MLYFDKLPALPFLTSVTHGLFWNAWMLVSLGCDVGVLFRSDFGLVFMGFFVCFVWVFVVAVVWVFGFTF